MQKVILDTNVIVSALIQQNYPFLIIYEVFFSRKIQLCLSGALFKEYLEVLSRPKFSHFEDFSNKAKDVLTEIGLQAEYYSPKIKLDIINDKDDNMILELADESGADFIITGNINDFTISDYKNTKIVTPRQYWENYRPK